MNSQIILGDNLAVLKELPSESIDLIYIDPPFFSNREYKSCCNVAFSDKWAGGINHYISWLYDRVEELYRVLKPTGSFYLHCDWHANAYIRVNILDKIFGDKNFIAECIWHYSWGVRTAKRWNRKHDNIFMYKKGENWLFNPNDVLEDRMLSDRSLERLQYKGALIRDKNKRGNNEKALPSDVWYIPTVNSMSKERIGYPTQKPEALLERIIKASSNEGDIVLDAFCGGGTTCAVARRLGRKFIGIDQSVRAIELTNIRLNGFNYDLVVYNSDRSSYV